MNVIGPVHGFECFLDRQDYTKGDDWKLVGAWALKRTGRLVLVGTPKALESKPVLREVQIFTSSGKRVIPIDFDGDLYGHMLRVEVTDWIREQRKFAGVDPLVAQMKVDLQRARNLSGMDPVRAIAHVG